MKLESTRLRGVLRFKDEVAISYRDLPAGLIAFVGENGGGKTTMLEGPFGGTFREFPSRSDKNILDYVTRPDGFIENLFELEGVGLFRTRLNLDGTHRASEGIIAQINPDGSETILNDGKVSTFDIEIAKLLPPKALLLASVFAAQTKAGSFGELDRKGRRELFASLLGLEHMQTGSDRARQAGALVQQAIETLTARRDVLARDADETVERELEQRAQQLQVEGGQVEVCRVELQREMQAIETTLAALQDAAAAHAAARTKADRLALDLRETARALAGARADLAAHQKTAPTERANLVAATDRTVKSLTAQVEDLTVVNRDRAAITARLTKTLADLDERIRNNQSMLDQAEAIRSAVQAIERLELEIGRQRIDQGTAQDRLDIVNRRKEVLINALTDVRRDEEALARAEQDAGFVQDVPCHGEGVYGGCPVLTNAHAAAAKIPGLREAVLARATVEAEQQTVETEAHALRAQINKIALHVAHVERQKIEHKAPAAKADKLAAAEARIAELQQGREQAQADAQRATADAQAREEARRQDLVARAKQAETEGGDRLFEFDGAAASQQADLEQAIDRLTQTLTKLQSDEQTLAEDLARTAQASTDAAAQTALLALRRAEWDTSTAVLSRVESAREDLQRRQAALLARKGELAEIDARLQTLHTDLIEWTVLSKALGRDGLQTLEIDDAGPTVSAFANDLLEACHSPFRIELVTQEAKRTKGKGDDGMREVFEVRVYHARDGGEPRDIGDLSGGEKVMVEEALKSAIALLVNQKHERPIRTCWRDETTGALNGENALNYMAMLRRAHQLGGYHQTIFVTHNPDAAQLADAQVRFAGGQITVVEPPYEAAA